MLLLSPRAAGSAAPPPPTPSWWASPAGNNHHKILRRMALVEHIKCLCRALVSPRARHGHMASVNNWWEESNPLESDTMA
eukprot:1172617-Prorocentrum_minimum.AAC.3